MDDETVAAFVLGEVAPGRRAELEGHLAGCAACTTLVAEYGKFFFQTHEPSGRSRDEPPGEPPLEPGTAISRYVVRGLLGRGGAADVYEAWDPQLKRKVALKLVRPIATPEVTPAEAEARLLREAEAMARLAHPHVVAVHDAGTFGGRIYIVMELVEGETLGRWLRAERREPGGILAQFLAAGRGLEAAHAAGVVHRDFKPDNVLVGRDGRARVTDFGLAGTDAAFDEAAGLSPSGSATVAGGTPLYMSPEQHRKAPATVASDQWSFCLALARALYNHDPYGLPARQAWAGGAEGEAPAVGEAPGVPAALGAVLARGLAVVPGARFPGMSALLGALEAAMQPPAPPPPPPRGRAVAAIAAAAAATIGLGVFWLEPRAPRAACGNGVLEPGEECDESGRGCSASCVRCDAGAARFSWAHNGSCYELFDERLSWRRASEACAARGGGLVSYGSAPEAAAIADALLPPEVETWIGLRREPNGGFAWSGGEAWADPLPTFFGKVDKPPELDCVFQRRAAPDRVLRIGAAWATARCSERRGYVCERAPWRRYDRTGHAYRVVALGVTWKAAVAACARMGAHLATVTSASENAFLTSHLTLPVWLGARNEVALGPFSWITGERFSFSAFAPREPDLATMEACLALGVDDLWHDRACGAPHAYLCEAE